jgi:hypothetical protein
MTGPLDPPNEPGAPTPDDYDVVDPLEPANTGYAPSVFMSDYTFPPGGSVVIPQMPRADGGLIQSVKMAFVQSLRDAIQGVSLAVKGAKTNISLEYPLERLHYPSIWVQFSITKLNRTGLGHEVQVQDPATQKWSFIQEWMFMGRITLTVLALDSVTRDQISDALIAQLAFARPPELLLSKQQEDVKQNRTLISALDENPYVAMTLQLDTIIPGGQTASMGTPFKEDILTYEDNYSFDLVGHFNQQFSNDGMYNLARIDPGFSLMDTQQPYNSAYWQPPVGPPGATQFNASGQINAGNVNYPAL